ncbi:MAG: PilZ domain-containing protein, partial [Ketobacteraceae bacterium]|nr:PilZ domain-containing protein [Ketobacteraceae bacterium]
LSEDPYGTQYNLPRQAILLSQLQAIDNESQTLLTQISDSNRAIGGYLRALDEKIDCIARHMISDYDDKTLYKERVDLSEGGLAFVSDTPYDTDSYIHLTMMLFPSYTTVASIGQVRSCDEMDDNLRQYRIGTEFIVLLEQDRKRLSKHIRRKQSLELRERSQKNQQN